MFWTGQTRSAIYSAASLVLANAKKSMILVKFCAIYKFQKTLVLNNDDCQSMSHVKL